MTDNNLAKITRFQEILKEVYRLPNLKLEINSSTAMSVFAALQVTLRDPKYMGTGQATDNAVQFARVLQTYLSVIDGMKQFCEKGWDPKADLP